MKETEPFYAVNFSNVILLYVGSSSNRLNQNKTKCLQVTVLNTGPASSSPILSRVATETLYSVPGSSPVMLT